MSKLILLPLFLLLSCGDTKEKKQLSSVGEKFRLPVAQANYEDNERARIICRALQNKEDMLNVLATSGTEYIFSYAQKSCNDNALPSPKDVVTTIVNSGNDHIFKSKNGEAFGFTEVERVSKGAMSEICNFGGTLVSPISQGSWAITWTTFVDSASCQPGNGSLCVHLKRSSTEDGTNYTLHTQEWIKFKVSNDRAGFFLEKNLISSAGCSAGNVFQIKASLK